MSDRPAAQKRREGLDHLIRRLEDDSLSTGPKPKWVAWTNDYSRALAMDPTLEGAREKARALGEEDPVLELEQPGFRLA